jgi:hypothetical protein
MLMTMMRGMIAEMMIGRKWEERRGKEMRGENLLSTQLKLACINTWFIAIHIPDLFGIYCDDGNE